MQDVPLKKPKKQQAWDKEGRLSYRDISKSSQQGRQAAMLAMELEPDDMSSFPHPDANEDENVMANPGDVAAMKLA